MNQNFHSYPILIVILLLVTSSCAKKVPSIHIRKEGTIGWEKKEVCEISYSDGHQTKILKAKIKCRGGISSKYFKHSFSLELDTTFSFNQLTPDDDWILNANYIDKTFMRHKISYDLFREMNQYNVASNCSYVSVNINDTYEGLYVLMQKINASVAGLNKRDSMAMIFKDPPVFDENYLLENQSIRNPFNQKFPKFQEIDKSYYLMDFMDFIFHANDTDFANQISSWIDIDNVVDWHLLLLFTNNSDGIMKNFYLYKIDSQTPFRIAIWDYDHSFGRDGDNEKNMMERELDCSRSVLCKRLLEIQELGYPKKMATRWFYLRNQNLISIEKFESYIRENTKLISLEINRNGERWPINDKWYYDSNDYNQELDLMREFVRIRIPQLDKYFQQILLQTQFPATK